MILLTILYRSKSLYYSRLALESGSQQRWQHVLNIIPCFYYVCSL